MSKVCGEKNSHNDDREEELSRGFRNTLRIPEEAFFEICLQRLCLVSFSFSATDNVCPVASVSDGISHLDRRTSLTAGIPVSYAYLRGHDG
jgi:hypothetical protein